MQPGQQRFVRSERELDEVLLRAKLKACAHCGRVGMLIGHGRLVGYDEFSSDLVVRGRRMFCSNRRRRRGCGRTFSVLLATTIKHCVARTVTLSRLLASVMRGDSVKLAWQRVCRGALSLRTGHRLWRRLLAAQPHLRTALSRVCSPPACDDDSPMSQTLAHLDAAIGEADCVLAGFQLLCQRGLFG